MSSRIILWLFAKNENFEFSCSKISFSQLFEILTFLYWNQKNFGLFIQKFEFLIKSKKFFIQIKSKKFLIFTYKMIIFLFSHVKFQILNFVRFLQKHWNFCVLHWISDFSIEKIEFLIKSKKNFSFKSIKNLLIFQFFCFLYTKFQILNFVRFL